MIALLVATEREARPLITELSAAQMAKTPFPVWQAAGPGAKKIRLLISGVGKVAAAAATASLLSQGPVDLLINVGACGALEDCGDFTPGVLCQVRQAVEGDRLGMGDRQATPIHCHQLPAPRLVGANLVTTDQPVFDPRTRGALVMRGQIVDMEGAAVARTAAWFGVPCSLIKGVTDPAGRDDRETLLANLDEVAAALARSVKDLLNESDI